ncbi:hypothetical protein PHSY_004480 [Pseudozyma hubeiensis SY62]|uniref:Uncharacterized protein n=1 Tax=Pseudozyma hubeiensis (strain SY62) TaxID=1305764 RepID=R9P6C1_PSEHS|nr:hypothetical protein PHSY_004480 [Pseudozyma hubeiensis SY62]GAC96896.1 hypothetical protein PHSY_004480 [Pseudozyma hubeiensis SY62]
MSHLTAQINISASPTDRPLPSTPIPLSPPSDTLSPSTQLLIPLSSSPSSTKPRHLSSLADSIDTARSNINKILTTWKDWSGKEHLPTQNNDDDDNDDDDEDQDEE